jgi:hypothetical protein
MVAKSSGVRGRFTSAPPKFSRGSIGRYRRGAIVVGLIFGGKPRPRLALYLGRSRMSEHGSRPRSRGWETIRRAIEQRKVEWNAADGRFRVEPCCSNGRNRRNLATRTRPGERPESKPTAAAQSSPREWLFLPLSGHSPALPKRPRWVGKRPLRVGENDREQSENRRPAYYMR